MYNPQNIKDLYKGIGEIPPSHLDLPSKKGLKLAGRYPHWSEKERERTVLPVEVEVICPECHGSKFNPKTNDPCEFCLGQGGWIEPRIPLTD